MSHAVTSPLAISAVVNAIFRSRLAEEFQSDGNSKLMYAKLPRANCRTPFKERNPWHTALGLLFAGRSQLLVAKELVQPAAAKKAFAGTDKEFPVPSAFNVLFVKVVVLVPVANVAGEVSESAQVLPAPIATKLPTTPPVTHGMPCRPCGPVAPAGPVGPIGPVAPVAPVRPAGPIGPVAPVAPVRPVGPIGPVAPVAPVRPVGPIGPVAPVAPVRPVGPIGPVAPVAPVRPVGPIGPVAPVAPVRPVGPIGPVAPVAPVRPVGPIGPVAPV